MTPFSALTSITVLASLAGAAHADVTRHDNSDLTFLMSPYQARFVSDTGFFPFFEEFWLDPDRAPDDQAGVAASLYGIRNTIDRSPPTGSGGAVDELVTQSSGVTRIHFAHTGEIKEILQAYELSIYQIGDTVDATNFELVPTLAEHRATLAGIYMGEFNRPYGDDFYIGVRIEEGPDWRYGYIRLEWKENIELRVVDINGDLTGETQYRDLYLPTAWAMESEPNTPITVTEPSDCPADVNGDGAVDPSDFTAWIDAYNNNLPACDQNDDGMCTPADFTAWVNNFNNGC